MKRTNSTSTISISRPFDARHIAGIDPAGPPPIPPSGFPALLTASQSHLSSLTPDDGPIHMSNTAFQPPKRSNSLVQTLTRPSLRLKSSLSRLRGRSVDVHRDGDKERAYREGVREPRHHVRPEALEVDQTRARVDVFTLSHKHQQLQQQQHTNSHSHLQPETQPKPAQGNNNSSKHGNADIAKSHNPSRQTRPKSAHSGTAIVIDNVPVGERPWGFQDILKESSFERRMRLYKRSREYWAWADHGLDEWVWRAASSRQTGH